MRRVFTNLVLFIFALVFMSGCAQYPERSIANLKSSIDMNSATSALYKEFTNKALDEHFKNIANLMGALSYAESVHCINNKRLLESYRVAVDEPAKQEFVIGSTLDNLRLASVIEGADAESMYSGFRSIAIAESADEVEELFGQLMIASERYTNILNHVANMLEADGSDIRVVNSWSVCPKCGYVYVTARLDEYCEYCQTRGSEFLLFQ